MLHFDVQKSGSIARINWVTAQETNTRAFVVEASTNGSAWRVVQYVPAAGNSTQARSYSIEDNAPAGGKNFYRIRTVDLNNMVSISDVKTLMFDLGTRVLVRPNPANTFLNIYVPMADGSKRFTTSLLTAAGQKVFETSTTQSSLTIPVAQLPRGVYYVRILKENSAETFRVMIQ